MDKKQHIIKILDLLYEDCKRSGGDGDGLWYSRYYELKDILAILQEYNASLSHPFTIDTTNDTYILWGDNQEWIIITDSVEVYKDAPEWSQMVIKC